MDALAIILSTVRETIRATGVPPDAVQDALHRAEHSLRASLGGARHHISRAPAVNRKAAIVDLAAAEITPQQAAERLGVTAQYVRRIWSQVRRVP